MMPEYSAADHVVLMSGGVDSYLAWRYLLNRLGNETVAWLFVEYGQPYMEKERMAVAALASTEPVPDLSMDFSCRFTSGNVNLHEDVKIPCRNLRLATIASYYGNTIWLGGMYDDNVHDKTREWASLVSGILTDQWVEWDREIKVVSPFWRVCKEDAIAQALQEDKSGREYLIDRLKRTVSCYSAEAGHCSKCPSCFRRWCAFTLNGIPSGVDPQKLHDCGLMDQYLAQYTRMLRDEDYSTYPASRMTRGIQAMEQWMEGNLS